MSATPLDWLALAVLCVLLALVSRDTPYHRGRPDYRDPPPPPSVTPRRQA